MGGSMTQGSLRTPSPSAPLTLDLDSRLSKHPAFHRLSSRCVSEAGKRALVVSNISLIRWFV